MQAEKAGARYLDGAILTWPRLIGTPEATILVSGEVSAYAEAESLLRTLAGNLTNVGTPVGNALALFNAALAYLAEHWIGFSHGAVICQSEGLDVEGFGGMMAVLAPGLGEDNRHMGRAIAASRFEHPESTLKTAGTDIARPVHRRGEGAASHAEECFDLPAQFRRRPASLAAPAAAFMGRQDGGRTGSASKSAAEDGEDRRFCFAMERPEGPPENRRTAAIARPGWLPSGRPLKKAGARPSPTSDGSRRHRRRRHRHTTSAAPRSGYGGGSMKRAKSCGASWTRTDARSAARLRRRRSSLKSPSIGENTNVSIPTSLCTCDKCRLRVVPGRIVVTDDVEPPQRVQECHGGKMALPKKSGGRGLCATVFRSRSQRTLIPSLQRE